MKRGPITRAFVFALSLFFAVSSVMPSLALAAEKSVKLEGTSNDMYAEQVVSKLSIGDVDAPAVGEKLDDSAVVRSKDGTEWDIPVLWVSSNLTLATVAEEGKEYLPALSFYLPEGIGVDGTAKDGSFAVTLSDDLVALFGGQDIISVYDATTGITYILPASLRSFFNKSTVSTGRVTIMDQFRRMFPRNPPAPTRNETNTNGERAQSGGAPTQPAANRPAKKDLVDIYCAQTAKNALSRSDLEYLVDLIINKLQPQSVNLLLSKFPSFRAGAEKGEIGKQIGLYIYYKAGDKDGDPAHAAAPSALAYVNGDHFPKDGGGYQYKYMIGIDVDSVTKNVGGKLVLVREGQSFVNLQNTIVHELFHAIMDDYNRTGMAGATGPNNITSGSDLTQAELASFLSIAYPKWFREGTASAVENVFQFRNNLFSLLMQPREGSEAFSYSAIVGNYLADYWINKVPATFPLWMSNLTRLSDGKEHDPTISRYVSGYLATLYLGELQARQNGGSSFTYNKDRNITGISSEKIRLGLDSILKRMHDGETLDQVIASISPVTENKTKAYTSTRDFEDKFLVGEKNSVGRYTGDPESMFFVKFILLYMQRLDNWKASGQRTYGANGSILFPFDKDFETPLDPAKNASTDVLKIIESNTMTPSTVPDEVALAGGGMTKAGSKGSGVKPASESEASAQETANVKPEELPMAAKGPATQGEEVEAPKESAPAEGEKVAAADDAPKAPTQDVAADAAKGAATDSAAPVSEPVDKTPEAASPAPDAAAAPVAETPQPAEPVAAPQDVPAPPADPEPAGALPTQE